MSLLCTAPCARGAPGATRTRRNIKEPGPDSRTRRRKTRPRRGGPRKPGTNGFLEICSPSGGGLKVLRPPQAAVLHSYLNEKIFWKRMLFHACFRCSGDQ